jgi:Ethanolamine utilization protein EutJ (predicted chaperonin)
MKVKEIIEEEGRETAFDRKLSFIDSDIEGGTTGIEVDEEGNVVIEE